uniref:Secreted protein n=1 Tax=Oryzias sinensis TaxID=183150 RepID=A0A8C7ZNE1_9TELE
MYVFLLSAFAGFSARLAGVRINPEQQDRGGSTRVGAALVQKCGHHPHDDDITIWEDSCLHFEDFEQTTCGERSSPCR